MDGLVSYVPGEEEEWPQWAILPLLDLFKISPVAWKDKTPFLWFLQEEHLPEWSVLTFPVKQEYENNPFQATEKYGVGCTF